MSPKTILFFADRLPPLTGGMEMHARYFIEYFTEHPSFPLLGVITKNINEKNILISEEDEHSIDLNELSEMFDPAYLFFNSGRWIEELKQIRENFPRATFIYRTGGNEILKAPLIQNQIFDHSLRQSFWVNTLNHSIDLMITNSAYTEKRLFEAGIACPFVRCVGGVNVAALKSSIISSSRPLTIFCGARFVPYKNHSMLLSVISELILRGYKFRVRLAGDGPLFMQAKDQVIANGLSSFVEFLGVLENEKMCQEINGADIYMQFSKDQVTAVPGGSYIHSEGMGRAFLEAITAGTFIIAGRCGALPEIVTLDRGLLVELKHLKQIVDDIEPVFRSPPTRLPFFEKYSWEKLFKFYETFLGNMNENIVNHRKM